MVRLTSFALYAALLASSPDLSFAEAAPALNPHMPRQTQKPRYAHTYPRHIKRREGGNGTTTHQAQPQPQETTTQAPLTVAPLSQSPGDTTSGILGLGVTAALSAGPNGIDLSINALGGDSSRSVARSAESAQNPESESSQSGGLLGGLGGGLGSFLSTALHPEGTSTGLPSTSPSASQPAPSSLSKSPDTISAPSASQSAPSDTQLAPSGTQLAPSGTQLAPSDTQLAPSTVQTAPPSPSSQSPDTFSATSVQPTQTTPGNPAESATTNPAVTNPLGPIVTPLESGLSQVVSDVGSAVSAVVTPLASDISQAISQISTALAPLASDLSTALEPHTNTEPILPTSIPLPITLPTSIPLVTNTDPLTLPTTLPVPPITDTPTVSILPPVTETPSSVPPVTETPSPTQQTVPTDSPSSQPTVPAVSTQTVVPVLPTTSAQTQAPTSALPDTQSASSVPQTSVASQPAPSSAPPQTETPASSAPPASSAAPATSEQPSPIITSAPVAPTSTPPTSIVPTGSDQQTQLYVPSSLVVDTVTQASFTPPASTAAFSTGGIPTTMPHVITAPGTNGVLPQAPENSTLIQIGFLYPLNYPFVLAHQNAVYQIFEILPWGLSYGLNIDHGKIVMQSLQPYDTTRSQGFITTVALAYIPTDSVANLTISVPNSGSLLYRNANETRHALMSVIDPNFPVLAGAGMIQGDGTSSGNPATTSTIVDANPLDPAAQPATGVNGTAVGIGVGVCAGAAVYGAAMFFIAKRYKQRKSRHSRSSSMIDTASEVNSMHGPMAGNNTAPLMTANDHDGSYGTRGGSRNSNGSAGSSRGRGEISAPVMAENSLGWN